MSPPPPDAAIERLFAEAAALHRAGRLPEAVTAWDRLLALAPTHADALSNRGMALAQTGAPDAALHSFDAALAASPRHGNALANAARLLDALGRPAAALRRHQQRAALMPDAVEPWRDAGISAIACHQYAAAVDCLRRADRLAPQRPDILANLAFAHGEAGQRATAVAIYDRLLAADPKMPDVREQRAGLRQYLCDWREAEVDRELTRAAIAAGRRLPVLPLLALVDEPALHNRAAANFLVHSDLPAALPGLPAVHPRGPRLRLAYVSGDIFAHATMFLIADMLEAHDRQRFEITLVSHDSAGDDAWRRRARAAVDHVVDIDDLDDAAAARLLRERQIDVAIDLKGLTFRGRPGIFTARAAPVQASWLGYPGSVGIAAHDYLIADRMVVPNALRHQYPERLVRLPGCYQSNAARFPAPAAARADHGLGDGMVYMCHNQSYKITPPVFAAWMAILRGVPDSQLWLLGDGGGDGDVVTTNLRRAAGTAGIEPDRLVFAPKCPLTAHLARLAQADLLLDTFPYNAHTTASDALGMGVPVLTIPGVSFASRVAASLNHAVGLDALTVRDTADYVATAIALGLDPGARAAWRARLTAARSAPLFDSAGFARGLEAAVIAMDARQRQGLPPADIDL